MSSLDFALIRHGQQAAGFDADPDPGLNAVGDLQAEAMAEALGEAGGRLLYASPLRRARQTAAAIERRWGVAAVIEPRVAEVPTTGMSLEARGEWLNHFLQETWEAQPPTLRTWRDSIADLLLNLPGPAVIVSHFVVVNAVVGLATGDHRVTPSMPDHCSINRFRVEDGRLHLIEKGAQRRTVVG
ncbi:histidine phosphatase family protein [Zavarzinia sp.]|uniref:histidine phosphatase family protein n=1 Tax=Zavarzinia sp. TaxID=2027920 RepID=UPI003566B210